MGVGEVKVAGPQAAAVDDGTQYYVIKSGDTLSAIAKQFYGDANQYPKIFEANREVIKDANLIFPGAENTHSQGVTESTAAAGRRATKVKAPRRVGSAGNQPRRDGGGSGRSAARRVWRRRLRRPRRHSERRSWRSAEAVPGRRQRRGGQLVGQHRQEQADRAGRLRHGKAGFARADRILPECTGWTLLQSLPAVLQLGTPSTGPALERSRWSVCTGGAVFRRGSEMTRIAFGTQSHRVLIDELGRRRNAAPVTGNTMGLSVVSLLNVDYR